MQSRPVGGWPQVTVEVKAAPDRSGVGQMIGSPAFEGSGISSWSGRDELVAQLGLLELSGGGAGDRGDELEAVG
jgi:hypothetical protein